MAERKAVNKYYPPDWDPRKQGSANKRVGQHPLRDRAKKLSQGILVIRFELPYNIWCGGCGAHIGMGVRYNAEKSKTGNYYTTPIYKFRMKCHLCDNYFEIQTDPQNHDYVILCGARRKEQRWDPSENGQIVPEDKATQKKMATDPMYKLEHGSDDKQKGTDQKANLAQLEQSRISMVDDYILNRMARDKFRTEKKDLADAAAADRAILEKSSLSLELLEETEEDRRLAGLMHYTSTLSYEDKQKEKRKKIEMRPLFKEATKPPPSEAGPQVLPYQRHTAPALSRRGEVKQRLGAALRASYSDPFKKVKVGKVQGSINAGVTMPKSAALGIKLKSPNNNNNINKSPGSYSRAQSMTPFGTPGSASSGRVQSASVHCKDANSNIETTKNSSNDVYSSIVNISEKSCKTESGNSSVEKIHKENECESLFSDTKCGEQESILRNCSSHKNQNSDFQKTIDISKSSHESVSINSLRYSTEIKSSSYPSPSKDNLTVEKEMHEVDVSLNEISTSSTSTTILDTSQNTSQNNSGLMALMSSYTETDSESDDNTVQK